jgi:hypothetical protein
MGLSRRPPMDVIRLLRSEVGFCCPVAGCGNPYLTWHHFDPPWRVEEHHRPEGLVALCLEHAHKADAGAFTDDQVREMKRSGGERAQLIEGRFDWRRKEVLVIVGGNFYLRTNVILELGGIPFISLSRDPGGYVLLNFTMPTVSGEPRAQVFENFWTVPPGVNDFECPPSGRSIRVWYGNGDELRVDFFEIGDGSAFAHRYPEASMVGSEISGEFPMTGLEVSEKTPGSPIEFSADQTKVGNLFITGSLMVDVGVAISAPLPPDVSKPTALEA